MAKKPCLLHIWPHWPSVAVSIFPLAVAMAAVITGHRLSTAMLLCALLLLPVCYVTLRSLSVYPDALVLRVAGIPVRRIPTEEVDGFVLVPAHAGHRGRTVPPAAVAVRKPGTVEGYCNERGLNPTGPLRCPNTSVHFNAGQEYTIWAVLEANGIPVAQFDDVLYRG